MITNRPHPSYMDPGTCRNLPRVPAQPPFNRLRNSPDGPGQGPIERFFRTLRQGLLEALPGYKGPDVYSRGLDPEGEAFLFIDELDAIIREMDRGGLSPQTTQRSGGSTGARAGVVAGGDVDHGIARSGYIEVPKTRTWPTNSWRSVSWSPTTTESTSTADATTAPC
jgi:integrase